MKDGLSIPEKALKSDIKYNGFLSYRGLRIVGWIFMSLGIVATTLAFGVSVMLIIGKEDIAGSFDRISTVFSYLSILPIPLFLIANFGIIVDNQNNYKKLLIKFGALALGLYLAFLFVYLRYGFGVFGKILGESATLTIDQYLELSVNKIVKSKLFFNVFIDILLCTLASFFLNYKPKTKIFAGKRVYLFRALVLIPIVYDVLFYVIRIYNNIYFHVPFYFCPLFPTKSPLLLLVFLIVIVVMKIHRYRSIKNGMSEHDYKAFLKTKTASLYFSILCSIALAVIALIDGIVLIVVYNVEISISALYFLANAGIGQSICMLGAIPFVMLYSYNKKVKKIDNIDILIPIAGIGLMIVAFLESAFAIFVSI